MNKKNKVFTKRHIIMFLIIVSCISYILAYRVALKKNTKPQIKYHNIEEKVRYGGIDYIFGKTILYDKQQFQENYKIDSEVMKNLSAWYGVEMDTKYIVTEIRAKRMEEETNIPEYYSMMNYYFDCNTEIDFTDLLNPNKTNLEDLQIGEETVWYEVFSVNDAVIDKELWKNCEKETFYIQLTDYKGHEYVDRIRVLN